MQPKPKKQVGEMGYPSQEKEFNAAMQKEWLSRKPGKPLPEDNIKSKVTSVTWSKPRKEFVMTKVMKKTKA